MNRRARTKNIVSTWVVPITIVLFIVLSFIYGWYFDESKGQSWRKFADQSLYASYTEKIANGNLPSNIDLHFPIGYPALGVVGRVVSPGDPYMIVSLLLLVGSALFCFYAVKKLFGTAWAGLFCLLLFYWDRLAITLHSSSELFMMPWNNQVLFFAFAFYFWLFSTKLDKKVSLRTIVSAGLVSGLAFVTREEALLFVVPAVSLFLFFTKSNWRRWLLCFALIALCFTPQLVVKYSVTKSFTKSTHDYSYSTNLTEKYLQPSLLYRNTWETLIDSKHFGDPGKREALLQASPWLWISPIGIILILVRKKFPIGLKLFTLLSIGLVVFYLSGANMAAHKIWFHCLRYISPGFIIMNFAVLVVIRELVLVLKGEYSKRRKKFKRLTTSLVKPVKRFLSSEERFFVNYWRIIEVLPIVILLWVVVFGVIALIHVLTGPLVHIFLWPFGVVVVVFGTMRVYKDTRLNRPGGVLEHRVFDIAILMFLVFWGVYNSAHTSQNIFIYRDPGIYAVTGKWLSLNDNLNIDAPAILENDPNITGESAGFSTMPENKERLYAQGLHFFPGLLGLSGRVGGDLLLFKVNILFGVLALLNVYGFARLLVKSRWAALAVVSLSLTLPIIYFSRDTYTEPLLMAIVFGSLTLLYSSIKKDSIGLWFFTGLAVASGGLVRADGLLLGVAACVFSVLTLWTTSKQKLKKTVRNLSVMLLGMSICWLLALVDAMYLSKPYYINHGDEMKQLLVVGVVIILVGGLLYPGKRYLVSSKWFLKLKRPKSLKIISWVIIAVIVAAGVFLASRPLWQVAYDPTPNTASMAAVKNLQMAAGDNIIPNRSYSEHTVGWLTWYMGHATVILGLVGLCILSIRMIKERKIYVLPFVTVFVASIVIFLPRIGAVPDQVWASRRFVPVIIPSLAVLAVITLDKLSSSRVFSHKKTKRIVVSLLSISLVWGPLIPTYPLLKSRTYVPQLSQISSLCSNLGNDSVAVLWVGPSGSLATQTIRSFCGVMAYRTVSDSAVSIETLINFSKSARNKGHRPMIVIERGEMPFLPTETQRSMQPVSTIQYHVVPNSLNKSPSEIVEKSRTIMIGELKENGTVDP